MKKTQTKKSHATVPLKVYVPTWYRDKTSTDKTSTGQKVYRTKRLQGQKVYRTKHLRDKTSTGTKHLRDKTSTGQNI